MFKDEPADSVKIAEQYFWDNFSGWENDFTLENGFYETTYQQNVFNMVQCKISNGFNEIYPIHSFDDRLSAVVDLVCFEKTRIRSWINGSGPGPDDYKTIICLITILAVITTAGCIFSIFYTFG